ncbi:hypothetical protein TNCV_965441 [Trichonephila clavipes]|nr:hypothetical protein TNCV_965441 [Trichonephila clavipes]
MSYFLCNPENQVYSGVVNMLIALSQNDVTFWLRHVRQRCGTGWNLNEILHQENFKSSSVTAIRAIRMQRPHCETTLQQSFLFFWIMLVHIKANIAEEYLQNEGISRME